MFFLLIIIFLSYIILFLYSLKKKDNSIVDVFWGFGFVIIACISFVFSEKGIPQYVITLLIIIWGIRLTLHIGRRKGKDQKEDPRYAKWRQEWGSGWYFYIRSFFQIYILQMILMIIIATPIFFVNFLGNISYNLPSGFLIEYIFLISGTIIAIVGFIFESIADRQLAHFIKYRKPGEIFTQGLYRYSRHPNYFGESMFWLGIGVIGLPYSYLAITGWLVITFLLLFVSGVPLQEERYKGRPNWEEYKSKTSVFIPWWPKK